jgi:hypothetical protein
MTTKYAKRLEIMPNYRKNIPNGHKTEQHFPFRGPPKFTQIWFENKPSGNPVLKPNPGGS